MRLFSFEILTILTDRAGSRGGASTFKESNGLSANKLTLRYSCH